MGLGRRATWRPVRPGSKKLEWKKIQSKSYKGKALLDEDLLAELDPTGEESIVPRTGIREKNAPSQGKGKPHESSESSASGTKLQMAWLGSKPLHSDLQIYQKGASTYDQGAWMTKIGKKHIVETEKVLGAWTPSSPSTPQSPFIGTALLAPPVSPAPEGTLEQSDSIDSDASTVDDVILSKYYTGNPYSLLQEEEEEEEEQEENAASAATSVAPSSCQDQAAEPIFMKGWLVRKIMQPHVLMVAGAVVSITAGAAVAYVRHAARK